AWACWASRNASLRSAEPVRCIRRRGVEPSLPWNFLFTRKIPAQERTCVKPIRILLADDHNVMRRGLRLLLESQPEFTVVAEAADGRQAVEQAEATSPDVVVLDIAMPNLSGIEAAQRIVSHRPGTAIVFLSMHSDEEYVLRALKAGAKGY